MLTLPHAAGAGTSGRGSSDGAALHRASTTTPALVSIIPRLHTLCSC